MAYSNYGRGNYGGGYNRGGGYNNSNGGGYQQPAQAPAPAPLDVHQEISNRFDLYAQFKDVAVNEKGITPTIKIEQDVKYYDTLSDEDDTQLQKALELLNK